MEKLSHYEFRLYQSIQANPSWLDQCKEGHTISGLMFYLQSAVINNRHTFLQPELKAELLNNAGRANKGFLNTSDREITAKSSQTETTRPKHQVSGDIGFYLHAVLEPTPTTMEPLPPLVSLTLSLHCLFDHNHSTHSLFKPDRRITHGKSKAGGNSAGARS